MAVSRWLQLAREPIELWETARAVMAMIAVEVGLKLTSLPRLAQLLGVEVDASGEEVKQDLEPPLHIARAARAARRIVRRSRLNGRCLREALVVGALLRHYRPRLRIGVTKEGQRVHAHAWLVIAFAEGRAVQLGFKQGSKLAVLTRRPG